MSLLEPESGLLFWMILSFGIVFLVVGKYGFPVITKMVDERKADIDRSLEEAREAREEMAKMRAESASILEEAYEQQKRLVKEGYVMRDQLIDRARQEAIEEKEKLLGEARRQIREEQANALRELRTRIVDISTELAEQVLYRQLTYKKKEQTWMNEQLDRVEWSENGKA